MEIDIDCVKCGAKLLLTPCLLLECSVCEEYNRSHHRQIPEDMDVPANRRDITDPSNVRWLLRNLAIRNSKHPLIDSTLFALTRKKEDK